MESLGTSTFNASLGQEQFLQLFVAQLQNQDPLEPVGQQDFLAQLAQFSTVAGIEQLNSTQDQSGVQFAELLEIQTLNSGTALLGKEVRFSKTSEDGEFTVASGIATEVQRNSGQVLVRVGEHLVPVSDINSVTNPTASSVP
jgi:flagellar basal-body rod modification protein FlgD